MMPNLESDVRVLMQEALKRIQNLRNTGMGKRGFTLIELLAVVAVIALIAALLLGGIPQILESSKKAQCASNLRQLGAAVHLYAADNDGSIYVPPEISTVQFVGKKGQAADINAPIRFLNPYIGGPFPANAEVPVAKCPADKGMAGIPKQYNSSGTSYMFNYAPPHNLSLPTLRSLPVGTTSFKLLNVAEPSRTLMVMSHPAFNYAGGGDRQQRWFKGSSDDVYVNACFVDGSVRFIRIARPGEPGYPDSPDYTWGVR